ncbi:MAG: Npun_F0813 family protein [Elainella sp.]
MFILKRQDVEIYSVQHPKKDQQVPILNYQGQTFRLLSVFPAAQEEEARALWRDLTDNRGKACVLLEEPERYSVWGKIRLEEPSEAAPASGEVPTCCVQACLLLLQAVYLEVEDLLGSRQASTFRKELTALFQKNQFPQANQPDTIDQLLTADPLELLQVPTWREPQLNLLLQELHRLGKQQFGNVNFVARAMETLSDMSSKDRSLFLSWLKRSDASKQWI